jgi:di/tricarboxylate transporter
MIGWAIIRAGMSPVQVILAFIILALALLMVSGRVRPDLLALLVLVILGLTGLVTPAQAYSGFSGTATMTILAIFIISEGLQQTGITLALGRMMLRASGNSEQRAVLITVVASAALSLFMNNIAAAGVLLPAVVSLSRQTRIPPSRLLMPLAFGTILGGMATLLTTANIIVGGVLRDAGLRPFGLLDFLPVGIPIVIAGTLFIVFVGRHLLPRRYPAGQSARSIQLRRELEETYGVESSLCEIEVRRGSAMAGLTLREGGWAQNLGVIVVGLARNQHVMAAPSRDERVNEGDIVFTQGCPAGDLLAEYGLALVNQPTISPRLTDEVTVLGEVLVSPRARAIGKTLREIHLRDKFGLNVIAVWRRGESIRGGLTDLELRAGDALLVQGAAARLRLLREERDFILLEEDPEGVLRPTKSRLAGLIAFVALAVAATGVLPVSLASLAGAVLMLLTGCLSMDDAYHAIEWKSVFLIAGLWPLGIAMTSSGMAGTISNWLSQAIGGIGPLGAAAALMLVATVLNQIMAGQTAVPVIMAPIALALAPRVGADPRAMAMAVALGSSLAFLTPIGHPVNTLVMGSGGYSVRDYLRMGAPLTLIVLSVALAGLFLIWGLR